MSHIFEPALLLIDSVEELEAAMADPEAFLKRLASSASAAGLRLLVSRARPVLMPHLSAFGLSLWVTGPRGQPYGSGSEHDGRHATA